MVGCGPLRPAKLLRPQSREEAVRRGSAPNILAPAVFKGDPRVGGGDQGPHSLGPGPSLHGWGWRGPRELEWVLGALAGASTTNLGSARPQIEAADTALQGHFPSPGHLPPHTPWCSFRTCRGQVGSYVGGRGVVGRTGLSGRQDTPGQGPLGQRPFRSSGPFSG